MKIEIGSYVKVTKGGLSGGIYKVFDISKEGNYIAIGVKIAMQLIDVDDVIIASEDDFNEANYDELSQDVSFF